MYVETWTRPLMVFARNFRHCCPLILCRHISIPRSLPVLVHFHSSDRQFSHRNDKVRISAIFPRKLFSNLWVTLPECQGGGRRTTDWKMARCQHRVVTKGPQAYAADMGSQHFDIRTHSHTHKMTTLSIQFLSHSQYDPAV